MSRYSYCKKVGAKTPLVQNPLRHVIQNRTSLDVCNVEKATGCDDVGSERTDLRSAPLSTNKYKVAK